MPTVNEQYSLPLMKEKTSDLSHVKSAMTMSVTILSPSLQTQPKYTRGGAILISVSAMVIRRADSTLSLSMYLPGLEFT